MNVVSFVRFLHRTLRLISLYPGLLLLFCIVFFISITSLRPSFYILGWDNFSSYFNLPTNIFRTFFAAWREYRGLGSASDSEVTDVFRQVIYLVLSPFVQEALLEQIYLLCVLLLGLLSMYVLARCLFLHTLKGENKHFLADWGGFFAAVFYLCNLETLTTFYFPMIMYTNRFFTLPLLFFIFVVLLRRPYVSKKIYACIIAAFFFMSGSYITATVFLTIVIALLILGSTQPNKKRFALLLIFYVGINAFWLLPFANYTMQKSKIIRLAPNFAGPNEIQLNKPKAFYDIREHLVLRHNFLDTVYYDITGTKSLKFHPLSSSYKEPFNYAVLWALPIFGLIGFVMIFWQWRKHRLFLWTPLLFVVFLFLSLKEFSPFGFFYTFFDKLTPYFGVLFRFGDTKFHIFLVLSLSIMAAFALITLLSKARTKYLWLGITVLFFSTFFVFRDYFMGDFIGSFMYNKLPKPYFEIANFINKDNGYFRVVHLPFDREAYWKSYSWGMVGSSFLNFMLNKPLMEKTFEPASMENAYFNKRLEELLDNAQMLSATEKVDRAAKIKTLFKESGVKYVIMDDTVQSSIYSRGVKMWGVFNNTNAKTILLTMEDQGFVKKVRDYNLYLPDYQYGEMDEEAKKLLAKNTDTSIDLYEVKDYQQLIQFETSSLNVDPKLSTLLNTPFLDSESVYLQDANEKGILYPFLRTNANISAPPGKITMELEKPGKNTITVNLPAVTSSLATHFIAVYANKTEESLVISFFLRQTPIINGQELRDKLQEIEIPLASLSSINPVTSSVGDYFSDWNILPQKQLGSLRLVIGNYVLPLPNVFLTESPYIGTVMVKGDRVPLSVLAFSTRSVVPLKDIGVTDYPNCFQDKLKDSSFIIDRQKDLSVVSRNQSTCLFYDLKPVIQDQSAHIEVRLIMDGSAKDIDIDSIYSDTSKPLLRTYVMSRPKPNIVRFCIKDPNNDSCYNMHQLINVQGNTNAVFPLERFLLSARAIGVLISLKNTGFEEQRVSIKEMSIDQFSLLGGSELIIGQQPEKTAVFFVDPKKNISLSYPKALSLYSFYFQSAKEGMYGYNAGCNDPKGYSTVRIVGGETLSYIENCFVEYFPQLPFSGDNTYLWLLSYNLLSGKFPRVRLEDNFFSYLDEYTSLEQGYPDIAGFKKLQLPESWYDAFVGVDDKEKVIENAKLKYAYWYIRPSTEFSDTSDKRFILHQDSENEGAMLLGSFDVQPLPTNWQFMSIKEADSSQFYSGVSKYDFKRLLPSFVSVSFAGKTKGKYLLRFNEGFDKQWVLYDSLFGVVTGIGDKNISTRCNGFANCYNINASNTEEQTVYILYTPERLSMLGWIITVGTVAGFLRVLTRKTG